MFVRHIILLALLFQIIGNPYIHIKQSTVLTGKVWEVGMDEGLYFYKNVKSVKAMNHRCWIYKHVVLSTGTCIVKAKSKTNRIKIHRIY